MDINKITELVKKAMAENEDLNKSDFEKAENKEFDEAYSEIKLEQAKKLSEEVMKRAAEIGVKAVCAVVNSGARPVLVECADDSFIASYDIALNKAYTSVSLKMKTSQLCELAQPGAPLYGIQHTNNGKIVIFGGGILLKNGDRIVGGFGVSGGTAEQDTYLGEFAEEVFEKYKNCPAK